MLVGGAGLSPCRVNDPNIVVWTPHPVKVTGYGGWYVEATVCTTLPTLAPVTQPCSQHTPSSFCIYLQGVQPVLLTMPVPSVGVSQRVPAVSESKLYSGTIFNPRRNKEQLERSYLQPTLPFSSFRKPSCLAANLCGNILKLSQEIRSLGTNDVGECKSNELHCTLQKASKTLTLV